MHCEVHTYTVHWTYVQICISMHYLNVKQLLSNLQMYFHHKLTITNCAVLQCFLHSCLSVAMQCQLVFPMPRQHKLSAVC